MPDNQATVTVKTVVEGGGAGGMSEGQIRQTAQDYLEWKKAQVEANRLAREQAAKGAEAGAGLLTPDKIDRYMQHLTRWKFGEQEINRLIEQRKKDLDAIQQRMVSPEMRSAYQRMLGAGATPAEAQKYLGTGGTQAEQQRSKVLERQLERLQMHREDLREGLYKTGAVAEESAKEWATKFGKHLLHTVRTTMELTGIGSAIGIAHSAHAAATKLNILQTDLALMLGLSPGQADRMRELSTAGPGAFGLTPENRMNILGGAYGGFGRMLDQGGINRFAGLGLAFGRGREGFASMAGEMSMTAFTPDAAGMRGAERFGMAALGGAVGGGLTQVQKQFYLESNRNLLELFTRFHGGKPLNAEEFVAEMNGLMQAVSGLGLVGGGLPMIRGMVEGAAGLVPMGKGTGEIYRMGALLGISPEEAAAEGGGNIGLGFTKLITNLTKPGNLAQLFQRVGRSAGLNIQPGQDLSGPQMNQFRVALADIFKNPQLAALTQGEGGVEAINAVLRGTTPKTEEGLQKLEEMKRIMTETAAGKDVSVDAKWTADAINQMGNKLVKIEAWLKESLGPSGAIVAAVTLSGLMGATPTGLLLAGATAVVAGGGYMLYEKMRKDRERVLKAQEGGQPAIAEATEALGEISKAQGLSETQQMIVAKARRQGVDPALALAIAQRESHFDPRAKNPSGAAGLFQVMPSNQRAFGLADPFDPTTNADVGMMVLKEHLRAKGGEIRGALKGYGGFVKEDPTSYINDIMRMAALWTSVLERNTNATEENTRITVNETGVYAKRPVPKAKGGSPAR